jgi:hypothetical protein
MWIVIRVKNCQTLLKIFKVGSSASLSNAMVGFFQELEFGLEFHKIIILEALQEEILHSPALIALWSASQVLNFLFALECEDRFQRKLFSVCS